MSSYRPRHVAVQDRCSIYQKCEDSSIFFKASLTQTLVDRTCLVLRAYTHLLGLALVLGLDVGLEVKVAEQNDEREAVDDGRPLHPHRELARDCDAV